MLCSICAADGAVMCNPSCILPKVVLPCKLGMVVLGKRCNSGVCAEAVAAIAHGSMLDVVLQYAWLPETVCWRQHHSRLDLLDGVVRQGKKGMNKNKTKTGFLVEHFHDCMPRRSDQATGQLKSAAPRSFCELC